MREIDLLEDRLPLRNQRQAGRQRNQQTDRISASQKPPPALKGGLYRKVPEQSVRAAQFAMEFRLTQSKHDEHDGKDDDQYSSYGVDVGPEPTLFLPIFELGKKGRRLATS